MNTHPVINKIFFTLLSEGRVIAINKEIKAGESFIRNIQTNEGGLKDYFKTRLKENDYVAVFSTPPGDNHYLGIAVLTYIGMVFLTETYSRSPHSGSVSKSFSLDSTDLLEIMRVNSRCDAEPAETCINKFNLHGGINKIIEFADSVNAKIIERHRATMNEHFGTPMDNM